MPLIADVVARIVEERGVRERRAIFFRAAKALAEGVEQQKREPLHVRRVGLFHVAPKREVPERSPACLARTATVGRYGCGLGRQSSVNAAAVPTVLRR